MNSIIEKYLPGKNIEVEYRIKISTKDIVEILKEMRDQWSELTELEQSVNIIYKAGKDESDVKKMVFNQNSESKEVYRKKRLYSNNYENFKLVKLTISSETPITSPASNTINMFRIKNRISINLGNYRIDITQVKEIPYALFSQNKQLVKIERTNLFRNIASFTEPKQIYENFISNPSNTEMEMEIEFNDPGKLNTSDFDFYQILESIQPLDEIISHSEKLDHIYNLLGNKSKLKSVKNLLSKPNTLDMKTYNEIYPPTDYYITKKADGYRCCLYIYDKGYALVSNRVYILNGLSSQNEFIIDCELMIPANVNDKELIIVGFDILMFGGENCTDKDFSHRLELLNKFYNNPPIVDVKSRPFKLEIKNYHYITSNLRKSFKSVIEDDFKYPIDGYIMTSSGENYDNTHHYKIKKKNTIDFLSVQLPKFLRKDSKFQYRAGYSIWLLFCGISQNTLNALGLKPLSGYNKIFPKDQYKNYIPIQFSPADYPNAFIWYVPEELEKSILKTPTIDSNISHHFWRFIELEPIFEKSANEQKNLGKSGFREWKFHGVRVDRINESNYFGNDFVKSAEPNWFISQNPVIIEKMWEPPTDVYFSQDKNQIYWAQTAAISFMKSKLIQVASEEVPNLTVLDLASGKGQDLQRFMNSGFKTGLFLDSDSVAISRLLLKRYELMKSMYNRSLKMKTYVGVRDLTKPSDPTIKSILEILPENPGLVICNLAIHYLVSNPDNLANFSKLVSKTIHKEGYFIYTTLDGAKIVELLKGKKEWSVHQDEVLKYKIEKHYDADQLNLFDQKIKIKLPFSSELYEENLVNIGMVNTYFEKLGFKIVETGHVTDFLPDMKSDASRIYNQLTDDDMTYIGLYSYSKLQFQ